MTYLQIYITYMTQHYPSKVSEKSLKKFLFTCFFVVFCACVLNRTLQDIKHKTKESWLHLCRYITPTSDYFPISNSCAQLITIRIRGCTFIRDQFHVRLLFLAIHFFLVKLCRIHLKLKMTNINLMKLWFKSKIISTETESCKIHLPIIELL